MAGGGREYARDAPWVASCLWTQCKFKSNEGLAKTFDEDVELLCEGVPREMRSIGPQMRMLWCKLKWEEGEAKRAGTPRNARWTCDARVVRGSRVDERARSREKSGRGLAEVVVGSVGESGVVVRESDSRETARRRGRRRDCGWRRRRRCWIPRRSPRSRVGSRTLGRTESIGSR